MTRKNLLSQLIFIATGLFVPIFAWAQTPDLGMTPYHIVNKLSGLCIHYESNNNPSPENPFVYKTATCSNSEQTQKFYVLRETQVGSYSPQLDGTIPFRIIIATAYDIARTGLFLASSSAFGSVITAGKSRAGATWTLARTGGTQTLTNTQFEGLITSQSTAMCMSYENHNPGVGALITVGTCENQDVWRLVPTSYYRSSIPGKTF